MGWSEGRENAILNIKKESHQKNIVEKFEKNYNRNMYWNGDKSLNNILNLEDVQSKKSKPSNKKRAKLITLIYKNKTTTFFKDEVSYETCDTIKGIIILTFSKKKYSQNTIKNKLNRVKNLKEKNKKIKVRGTNFSINAYIKYYNNNSYFYEIVIQNPNCLSRNKIILERDRHGFLLIGEMQISRKVIEVKEQQASKNKVNQRKNSKKGIDDIRGACFSVLGIILTAAELAALVGAVATGGIAAVGLGALTLTVVYGANTLISSSYQIMLDYQGKDDKIGEDTFLNNPIKYSLGNIFEKMCGSRRLGHNVYYISEIFQGGLALRGTCRAGIRGLQKTEMVSTEITPILRMPGKVQRISKMKTTKCVAENIDTFNSLNENATQLDNEFRKEWEEGDTIFSERRYEALKKITIEEYYKKRKK